MQARQENTDVDHPNVVNENELEWAERAHGEKFGYRRKSLSAATGGEKLGCKSLRDTAGAQGLALPLPPR